MNFKFIEGRKTSNKVVKFRGVGVAYKEVVQRGGSSVQGSRPQQG